MNSSLKVKENSFLSPIRSKSGNQFRTSMELLCELLLNGVVLPYQISLNLDSVPSELKNWNNHQSNKFLKLHSKMASIMVSKSVWKSSSQYENQVNPKIILQRFEFSFQKITAVLVVVFAAVSCVPHNRPTDSPGKVYIEIDWIRIH